MPSKLGISAHTHSGHSSKSYLPLQESRLVGMAVKIPAPLVVLVLTLVGVTVDGGLDWRLDLLTTYTHDSTLQAITAPPLIFTNHHSTR
jgi:hypothetical protein